MTPSVGSPIVFMVACTCCGAKLPVGDAYTMDSSAINAREIQPYANDEPLCFACLQLLQGA